MNFERYQPGELLRPYVKNYFIVESDESFVNRLLPDTSPVMALRFRGRVSHLVDGAKRVFPVSMLSGLRKFSRQVNYSNQSGNLLIIFKVGAVNAFIREPLFHFFEDSIALTSLEGFHHIGEMEEQLSLAKNHAERICIVERFLISRLKHKAPDLLVQVAIEKIQKANGSIRIRELANTLCINQDSLEKRFRNRVGTSPKQFAYLVRMKNVLKHIRRQPLVETALEAGYFDQSHFSKDFKLFTGQTPTDFIKTRTPW